MGLYPEAQYSSWKSSQKENFITLLGDINYQTMLENNLVINRSSFRLLVIFIRLNLKEIKMKPMNVLIKILRNECKS
jgi:hypothetical protein